MNWIGRILAVSAFMCASAASAASAPASCPAVLDASLSETPYFTSAMEPLPEAAAGQHTFRHRDDPRMIVNFTTAHSESVAGQSRSGYVAVLKGRAEAHANKAKAAGRWAEGAVYPFDPVGWRTVEETELQSVGDALVAHAEFRVTSDCTLVADMVSPSSLNLRSRWSDMMKAVDSTRDAAARHVMVENWEPDDTTPVGIPALAGGFLAPLAVMVFAYVGMSGLFRYDDPNAGVRSIIGSAAAVCASALVIQASAFEEGLASLRYADNLLLYAFTGMAAVLGCLLGHRAALFALTASSVTGCALAICAAYGWTPSPLLNGSLGGVLIAVGTGGLYLWSIVESGAFRNVRRG